VQTRLPDGQAGGSAALGLYYYEISRFKEEGPKIPGPSRCRVTASDGICSNPYGTIEVIPPLAGSCGLQTQLGVGGGRSFIISKNHKVRAAYCP